MQLCVFLLSIILLHGSSYQSQLEKQRFPGARCNLNYFDDTRECKEGISDGYPGVSLGTVKLAAYVHTYNSYSWPGINITFLDVKWTDLWLTIKLKKKGSSRIICHKFHLPENVSHCQQLYLDGQWYGPDDVAYKGEDYNIEYEAYHRISNLREYGKFSLHIPIYSEEANHTHIANWELFVYVDVTGDPEMTVHWMAPPRWLGGVRNYNVTFHYTRTPNNSEEVQVLRLVGSNEELQYTHVIGSAPGAYRFGVQIIDPACGPAGCKVFYSPTFIIEGHSGLLITVIVLFSVLIPLVLCISYILMKWLKQIKKKIDMKPPPVVLIIYVPTHRAHIRVVKELASYLQSYCGLDVLLHDNGVPQENVAELQSWFIEAYKRANFVVVVSSPLQHTALRETIYIKAGEIGLKLLWHKFSDHSFPPENVFCIMLPYCIKEDLPKDTIHFRKFFLMHNLDQMLRHLRSEWGGLHGKVLSLLRLDVPGGSAHYKEHGGELRAAIDEATISIQKDITVYPVVASSSNHIDSTESSLSSPIPLVHGESENLLDPFMQRNHHVQPRSPFYPENVLPVIQPVANQPPRRSTTRRYIDQNIQL